MTEKRNSTDLPPEGKSRSKRIGKLDIWAESLPSSHGSTERAGAVKRQ